MAYNRLANKRGTPREIAEHASGYTANGEGEHSRRISQGRAPIRLNHPPRKFAGKHTLADLITECERRIEWMKCELKITDNRRRRAKLTNDLEIRGKFLTRLLLEKREGKS